MTRFSSSSDRDVSKAASRRVLMRQLELEAIWIEIAKDLQGSEDIATALQTATESLRSLIGCDRVFIFLRESAEPSGGRPIAQAVAEERWRLDDDIFRDDGFADGAWQQPTASGHILLLEDTADCGEDALDEMVELSERDRQFLEQTDAYQATVVPICVSETCWGIFVANQCQAPPDNDRDVREADRDVDRDERPSACDPLEALVLLKRLAVRLGLEIEHGEIFDRLEAELQERWRAEKQIGSLNEALELRVAERTQALKETNQTLKNTLHENELLAEKWRTSEATMRAFFSSMTEIILTIDADLNVTHIAPTNPQLLYGPNTDVLDRTIEMFYSLEAHSAIGRELRSALTHQRPTDIAYSLEVDGIERTFQARICPTSADCVTWVAQDVTTLESEEVARETERRLGHLMDSVSHYGIFLVDPDGTIASWSRGAEEIHGYKSEEAIGQPYMMLFDDATITAGVPKRELDLARRDGRYEGESLRKHRQGHAIWTNVTISAIDERSSPDRSFAIVVRDITEERRVKYWQQMLERGIDACSNGVIVTDASQPLNPVVYVNSGFEAMTGYSEYESIGRNCRFLQGDDCDQPGLEILRQALRDETGCCVTLRNYRRDGSMFWNELTISPVRNERGLVTHYIGVATDVTTRANAYSGSEE